MTFSNDIDHKIPIPQDVGAVNATWVTGALSSTYPGLQVESAQVVESLGGACTKLRVAIRTNRPDFPATVIVKGCFEPHTEWMKVPFYNEVLYYDRVVDTLGVETVEILFSQADDEAGSVIVMEDLDLRGATCLRTLETIAEFKLAAAFLTEIARFHARWWGTPEVARDGSLGWVRGAESLPPYVEILLDPVQFEAAMNHPRAAATPRVLKDPKRLLAALQETLLNRFAFPLTINHGDLHLANLYKTAGRPGFLDWSLRRLPWGMDVTYFIVGCLDPVDRRRWDAPLLQHYLDALAFYGVEPPDFDVAWQAFRGWPIWGEITWLFNRTEFHSEAACTAMATRYGQAMIDLDSFGALCV